MMNENIKDSKEYKEIEKSLKKEDEFLNRQQRRQKEKQERKNKRKKYLQF